MNPFGTNKRAFLGESAELRWFSTEAEELEKLHRMWSADAKDLLEEARIDRYLLLGDCDKSLKWREGRLELKAATEERLSSSAGAITCWQKWSMEGDVARAEALDEDDDWIAVNKRRSLLVINERGERAKPGVEAADVRGCVLEYGEVTLHWKAPKRFYSLCLETRGYSTHEHVLKLANFIALLGVQAPKNAVEASYPELLCRLQAGEL